MRSEQKNDRRIDRKIKEKLRCADRHEHTMECKKDISEELVNDVQRYFNGQSNFSLINKL